MGQEGQRSRPGTKSYVASCAQGLDDGIRELDRPRKCISHWSCSQLGSHLSYILLQFWKVSLNSVSKGVCLLSVFSLEVLPPAVTNSCTDSFNNRLVDVVSELGEGKDRISMGHREPLPARTACFLSCLYRTTSCRCVAAGVLRVKVIKRNLRFGEKVFIPPGRCRGPN